MPPGHPAVGSRAGEDEGNEPTNLRGIGLGIIPKSDAPAGETARSGKDQVPKGLIGADSADQAPWPSDVTAATRKR